MSFILKITSKLSQFKKKKKYIKYFAIIIKNDEQLKSVLLHLLITNKMCI